MIEEYKLEKFIEDCKEKVVLYYIDHSSKEEAVGITTDEVYIEMANTISGNHRIILSIPWYADKLFTFGYNCDTEVTLMNVFTHEYSKSTYAK